MTSILWHGGKLLQMIALVQVGYALIVGLGTNDSGEELKLMLLGVGQFLVGLVLIKVSKKGGPE